MSLSLNAKVKKVLNIDTKFAFLLTLFIPVLIELLPEWYEWFGKEQNGLWVKQLYVCIDGRWMINVPISIIIIVLTAIYGTKLYKDNSRRSFRLPLLAIGFIILYWGADGQVIYAKITPWFDYQSLCCLMLIALFFVRLVSLVRIRRSRAARNEPGADKQKGFSDDSIGDDSLTEDLKKYADTIAHRLINTDVSSNSYAVGITGEWGVGKTTFLNILKDTIQSHMDVVEFNPWMCRTPEQVTDDFFALLQQQLSPKYSALKKSIKEYARQVSALTVSHKSFSVDLSNLNAVPSLSQKKIELSSKFEQLPNPVAVIIDDVDRLEREEVFEVLRLIRNTADLPNILYLVAYDKEYITTVLAERKIKDASSYLEKIFHVEVHLPKVQDYLIWDRLKDDFESQNDLNDDFTDKLFRQFKSQSKELILRVLDNYRRAKRFSRLYMVNARYLSNRYPGEIHPIDFFWLELLQVYDKKTYNILANDSYTLLYYDGERLKVRGGIIRKAANKDASAYTGERFWREETPNIIDKVFGNYIQTTSKSVCYVENYNKYFTLGVSKFRLTFKDFKTLFADIHSPEELVEGWLNDGKYFSSIMYHLKQVDVNKLEDSHIKAFVSCALYFGMMIAPYRNSGVCELKNILRASKYEATGKRKAAQDVVQSWMESRIAQGDKLLYLSRFLNTLYIPQTLDEDNSLVRIDPILLTNEEVEGYLIKVMTTFLNSNLTTQASDILKENSQLAYLFKNCCVTLNEDPEGVCTYKQVAFDVVIKHFSRKKRKQTKDEFDSLWGILFSQEAPVFTNPQDEYDYWEYHSERMDRMKTTVFGNNYNAKLREFKDKCFV